MTTVAWLEEKLFGQSQSGSIYSHPVDEELRFWWRIRGFYWKQATDTLLCKSCDKWAKGCLFFVEHNFENNNQEDTRLGASLGL